MKMANTLRLPEFWEFSYNVSFAPEPHPHRSPFTEEDLPHSQSGISGVQFFNFQILFSPQRQEKSPEIELKVLSERSVRRKNGGDFRQSRIFSGRGHP